MGCGSGGVFEICAAKQVGRREEVVGCVNICTRARSGGGRMLCMLVPMLVVLGVVRWVDCDY